MRIVFQIALPAVVRSTNVGRRMSRIPAGMEISDRKIGIIRPKNTAFSPCRSNQATVVCTSSTSTSGIFTAMRAMRSMPIHLPRAHSRTAPTREPTVARTIAAAMLICPWLEVKPAKGRTSSLGMGGKTLSKKTINPTPSGPSASMMVTVHAEKPLRCSAAPSPTASMKSGPGPVSGVVGMVKSVDKGAAGHSQCTHSG